MCAVQFRGEQRPPLEYYSHHGRPRRMPLSLEQSKKRTASSRPPLWGLFSVSGAVEQDCFLAPAVVGSPPLSSRQDWSNKTASSRPPLRVLPLSLEQSNKTGSSPAVRGRSQRLSSGSPLLRVECPILLLPWRFTTLDVGAAGATLMPVPCLRRAASQPLFGEWRGPPSHQGVDWCGLPRNPEGWGSSSAPRDTLWLIIMAATTDTTALYLSVVRDSTPCSCFLLESFQYYVSLSGTARPAFVFAG